MRGKVLLVTPQSLQYSPPERIATLDKFISEKYSKAITSAVNNRLKIETDTFNAFSKKNCVSMGLLMLGSALKELVGLGNVQYVFGDNFNDFDSFMDFLISEVNSFSVFCFTGTTPQMTQVERIARALKSMKADCKIVLGGSTTFIFENEVKPDWIDAIVIGNDLKSSSKMIASYINDNADLYDIYSFDFQDYPIDFSAIPRKNIDRTLFYTFSSYGCTRACTYCMEHRVSKRLHCLSVEKKLNEIKYIVYQANTKFVHFADSDFFANIDHAKEIISALEESQISACYSINISPFTLISGNYRELLGRFLKIGLIEVLIGIEHTAKQVLIGLKKNYDIKKLEIELNYLKHEIQFPIVSLYTLVGLPYEFENQIKENIEVMTDWKRKGLFDFTFPKFFVPYPGTNIYKNPAHFGVEIKSINYTDYQRWSIPRVVEIRGMTDGDYLKEVEELYKLI